MAIGPLRLADKSAWEQTRYDPRARDRLLELRRAEQLAVCVVSISELLYSARDATEISRLRLELSSLPYLHLTEAAERQVEELMVALAARGQHRTPIPDLMLAVHYDSDYERVAAVSGQPHEWIIPRGQGRGITSGSWQAPPRRPRSGHDRGPAQSTM